MNILLVNLARMGDLVQTTPAIQGFKAMPGTRVSVLVTSNLTDFAHLLGADEVIPFDESVLLPHLLEANRSISRAGKVWRQWIQALRDRVFDEIINLTHDDFSAHLVSMIGAKVNGRYRATNGEIVIRGDWMRYFFTMFHFRQTNPFNLADVYRLGSGIDQGAIPVSMRVEPLNEELTETLAQLPKPIVALHPGANHPARQWPLTHYAELADRLAAGGASVVLLGGPTEFSLCESIALQTAGKPLVLAGKTSITQLPAVLNTVDLLVTNDTGPLHIAAAAGTKTVSVFLAMARPQDTAPCAEGHLILETLTDTHPCPETEPCLQCSCGQSVPVDAVEHAVNVQLGSDSNWDRMDEGCYRVLLTRFADDGCLDLDEIHRVGSNRQIGEPASSFRSVWTALLLNQPAEGTRIVDPILWDAEPIEEGIVLAERMLARLDGENEPETLGQLEAAWLKLEHRAGDMAAFLLYYRLQREALYVQGIDAVRTHAHSLFERWAGVMRSVLEHQGQEVTL